MTRNSESHFSQLPDVNIERSVMDLSHGYMTTGDCGDLIPVFFKEVLPGDTWQIETSMVVRAQTLLTPIFSNINVDYYFYFCPMRLVWDHTKEFYGENTASAWIPSVEYTIPRISSPSGGFALNTLADYLGYPVGVEWAATDKMAPSALPFRVIAKICDEWHRDQNVTDPLNIPTGDSNQTGSNGTNYINDVANGGMPFKAARYHDYFSSCLPGVSKHDPISFGTNAAVQVKGLAPVGTTNIAHSPFFTTGDDQMTMVLQNPTASNTYRLWKGDSNNVGWYNDVTINSETNVITTTSSSHVTYTPNNLYADLDDVLDVSGVTFNINDLRLAFQLQKFYEKQARGGSRMIETLRQHFGVVSPDARLQRTEYLGGKRVPLMIHEVTNSAQTSTDFLGDVGAKLATSDRDTSVVKSFTEPGYICCLAVVRYPNYYPQGVDRQFLRKKFSDFYWPVFANIGEQPVYDCEIYADATTMANDSVFGYQEAYADYRYSKDICTASMRPGVSGSLASWHLADYYTQKPTLSDSWMRMDKTNVDRVLAVTSSAANQFFFDFWFDCRVTRPMPVYSIPGLIDHH